MLGVGLTCVISLLGDIRGNSELVAVARRALCKQVKLGIIDVSLYRCLCGHGLAFLARKLIPAVHHISGYLIDIFHLGLDIGIVVYDIICTRYAYGELPVKTGVILGIGLVVAYLYIVQGR